MPSSIFKKLLPYALVVFLGYLGFALPLPVLPELFLDPERSILGAGVSIQKKTFLLGLMLAAYPSGQLIGCPLLGWLSDRFGRKKIILISLMTTAMGYVWTALATDFQSLVGMFWALFVCGFSEGNAALAQAVIGDLSPQHKKATHFGWINLFTCMAFIIGPLMGGFLADPHHSSLFSFATPFWAGACLSLIGAWVIWRYAEETKKDNLTTALKERLSLLWNNQLVRTYYTANFLIYFGIYTFFNCLGIYLERRFDFTTTGLAYVMSYDSFFFAIGLLTLVPLFARRWSSVKICYLCAIIFGSLLILLLVPKQPVGLIYTIPPIGMTLAVLMTHAAVMVSNGVGDGVQGQALGVLQSVQVLAAMSVGVVGGILAALEPTLPLVMGAAVAIIGGLFLRRRSHYA